MLHLLYPLGLSLCFALSAFFALLQAAFFVYLSWTPHKSRLVFFFAQPLRLAFLPSV
jgi:hypothetical protein